jgi:signal transduction histidine kinase
MGSLSAVGSIVHDLRSPLATIHGGAEMLVRSKGSHPQANRIARNMYCVSVRMRELIEELVDRSRRAEKEMEPCDIHELVTTAVEKVAVSAEFQSVQIAHVVPEGLIVTLDRRLIRISRMGWMRWKSCPREPSIYQQFPTTAPY